MKRLRGKEKIERDKKVREVFDDFKETFKSYKYKEICIIVGIKFNLGPSSIRKIIEK